MVLRDIGSFSMKNAKFGLGPIVNRLRFRFLYNIENIRLPENIGNMGFQ